MAFLITNENICLIQGITGKEGQRACEWMLAAGTQVVAGVTPGKGGQEVLGVPVFNSVAEAVAAFPMLNTTCAYAPPKFVKDAVKEAVAAGIKTVHVFAENVPVKDSAELIELCNEKNVILLGPSSVGAISPGKASLGSIGGGNLEQFLAPKEGNQGVAVISKSGGMSSTIANMLALAGIPQTTVVGIGGDRLIGTTYGDLLPLIAADDETKAVVIIGEIGGAYEEMLAEKMMEIQSQKPVIALIAGLFAETLPQGISFGHAGAIVSKTEGTRKGKIEALQKAGALIAESPGEIIDLLKNNLL